jgi:MFS family permease
VTFVYGFELVYLVFVADDILDLGAGGIGYLNAAIGVGGALGALITNRLANSPRVRLVMGATLLGCGVPLGLLAVITEPWIAYVVLAVEGLASIALDVVVTTALQRVVPQAVLARVSAVLGSLTVLAILLGNLAAVALLSVASLHTSLIVSGALLPLLAVALLPSLRDLERRSGEGRTELEPVVAAILASGLLEGAPLPAVERLAASVLEERVSAGAVLLRQGDEAADVFVLSEGRLDVAVNGALVNVVEAPGYVGEIGLLLRSRRTATVTAATDAVVHRISGPDFVDAVGSARPVALRTEMAVRLRRASPS